MPLFEYDSTSIYYEEHGRGFPLLLIAPGAMNSIVEMWANATINPLALYRDAFRLIAMDQRNAGRSFGPLELSDPWGAYARDQLALLDHLGIDRFHVMGCCIGGSFALKLIEQAPARVAAAVLEQPVGIADGNGPLYEQMWRGWADRLSSRPYVAPEAIEQFGTTPMLVLPGTDRYHPTATGREIAALAPNGQLFEPWNDSQEHVDQAGVAVRSFLEAHVGQQPA